MTKKLWKQDVAKAKADLEHWQQIAGVAAERKKAEAERIRKGEEEVLNGQTEGGVEKPGSTNLSDEKDEHGYQFVNAADGTTVFGQIHEDSGLKAAPIKLSEGFNKKDERGNNVGYGLRHIEAGHGDQILEAGYSSVEEFVEDVTRNYREIRIGKDRRTNKTYMLLEIHDDKHKRTLYVELSRDGQYWNVNSGGIFKTKYTDKNDIVWPGPTMGSSANTDVAEVADSPADAVRGVTVDRGGNSSQPISSAGKDMANFDSVQENDGKNAENVEAAVKTAENATSEGAAEAGEKKEVAMPFDGVAQTEHHPADVNTEPTEATYERKEWSAESDIEEMEARERFLDNATTLHTAERAEVFPEEEVVKRERAKLQAKVKDGTLTMEQAQKEYDAVTEKYSDYFDRMEQVNEELHNLRSAIIDAKDRQRNEAEAAANDEAKKKLEAKYNGYLKGKAPYVAANTDKALSERVNFGEEGTMTVAEFVEKHHAAGDLSIEKKMFAPAHPKRWDAMTGYEQDAWKKTHQPKEECVVNGWLLGKTAYDYAQWLSENHPAKAETTESEPHPIGKGAFGDIYDAFKGKAKEAIIFLRKKKSGEALGALHHKDIGDIDLVWGEEGSGKSDGFGLAKLVKYHPEVLDNLQEIIDDMEVTSRSENRVQLESKTHQAAVRLTWDKEKKNWLLTAFEKKNSVSDNTTDTGGTLSGNGNDTATPQNTVSAAKVAEENETSKFPEEKNVKIVNGNNVEIDLKQVLAKPSGLTVGKKGKGGISMNDFLSKNHPVLRGVRYENGAAVASDGHVLLAVKTDYPKEYEGKTIDKNGNPIEGRFPNWKSVIPYSGESVDLDAFIAVVDEAKSKLKRVKELKAEYEKRKKVDRYAKPASDEQADALGQTMYEESFIVVPTSSKPVVLKYELALAVAKAVKSINNAKAFVPNVEKYGDRICVVGDGAVALCLGIVDAEEILTNETAPKFYVGGKVSYHKADGVAPLTHEEQVLRDALAETMQKSGIEVIDDVEEGQRVLDEANGKAKLQAKQKRALETASVSQSEEHQPTVVSSADGAKVINNIDNLATKCENLSNQTKTFVGDIAEALGATKHGSNSEYATFETKNGKIVTIRIANHNAKVSTFDNHGEADGISIVVSPKRNGGITNDGEAHVVEYFYDAIKLRRAEGKPLAEIVRSIKQVLYSGEFKDATGLAERQEVNAEDVARLHKVYHGSGADKVRFFRTKDGEAYGFTVGGKIYFDPKIATSETLVHEYAHLWATALKSGNPEEWKNVVELMKGTSVWDEVRKSYPELETEDEIADEVIAQYSGRKGAERLRAEQQKIAGGNGGVFEKAEAISALQRVKRALDKFWRGVCDFLHIHYTSAEEVADRVMKDLLDGVDPRKFGVDENSRFQFVGESRSEGSKESLEFHKVIDQMFDDVQFDNGQHQRERYNIGKTPEWMKRVGITGEVFSLSFKNIKVHRGKDADHDLTREEWHALPSALRSPFAVTRYKGADDRFRLYVNIYHNGKPIAVGVDVKRVNQGKGKPMLDVNSIKTVFAHGGEIGTSEVLVAYDERITPEQEALLRGLNFREYPTVQELSAAKVGTNSESAKKNVENLSEDKDLMFRPVFGGNRGYVGYSKSVRAVEAEERGLKSVSQMDRDFADEVSRMVSEELGEETMLTLKEVREAAKAGRYDEWHHTSVYGNKTKYYSAETIADNIVAAKREQDELDFQDRSEREEQIGQAHDANRRELIANEHGVTVKTKDRSGVNDWVTDDVFRSSNGYAIVVDNGPKKKGWWGVRVLNEGQEEAYYSPYLSEDYIYGHKGE